MKCFLTNYKMRESFHSGSPRAVQERAAASAHTVRVLLRVSFFLGSNPTMNHETKRIVLQVIREQFGDLAEVTCIGVCQDRFVLRNLL